MAEITSAELDAILSGDPDELGVHLHLVERDIVIDGHTAHKSLDSFSFGVPLSEEEPGVTA